MVTYNNTASILLYIYYSFLYHFENFILIFGVFSQLHNYFLFIRKRCTFTWLCLDNLYHVSFPLWLEVVIYNSSWVQISNFCPYPSVSHCFKTTSPSFWGLTVLFPHIWTWWRGKHIAWTLGWMKRLDWVYWIWSCFPRSMYGWIYFILCKEKWNRCLLPGKMTCSGTQQVFTALSPGHMFSTFLADLGDE